MKQSLLFSKTVKSAPAIAASANHDLLVRGGFIDQLAAGIYSYLPLGFKVLTSISRIIREEMDAIGGQEVFLPALHPKENWVETDRWETMDILFKTTSQNGSEYALGPTHEEVIVPLAKKHINSYRDVPRAWYQIQTKFRDELRTKAGLLRGREFLMKDMYSFHADAEDLQKYYETVKKAYHKVFSRCGLAAILTEASGGSFTKKFSHEFQVATPHGEDTIFTCECGFAQNKEIAKVKKEDACPDCGKSIREEKTIEVGNIFDLGTKFSDDFELTYADEKGKLQKVVIGCYGIGVSRLMGAIVEIHHDERGIMWPKEVAPYQYHLLSLSSDPQVLKESQTVYEKLQKAGHTVLWDDREATNGEKLAESDLVGIPHRLVVSPKTGQKIEYKHRAEEKTKLITVTDVIAKSRATA